MPLGGPSQHRHRGLPMIVPGTSLDPFAGLNDTSKTGMKSTPASYLAALLRSLRRSPILAIGAYAVMITLLYLNPFQSKPQWVPLMHGSSPTHKGSCWCGAKDGYCLCTPSLAIDVILESRDPQTDELKGLVFVQRKDGRGTAVLGGFVDLGETVEQAVAREVKEETGGGQIANLRLLGTYSNPYRDNRRHTVSAVFVASITGQLKAGDDAKEIVTVPLEQVSSMKTKWAFDHEVILRNYLEGSSGSAVQDASQGISLCAFNGPMPQT